MNKFRAMSEHIQARRSIGIPIGRLEALRGYAYMLFVDQELIEGATRNIRAGLVRYDAKKNRVYVG